MAPPPRSLDRMHGYFQVFLTPGLQGHPDPGQWPSRVVLPEGGTVSVDPEGRSRLVLAELLPNQQYFLKVELHLMTVEGGTKVGTEAMGDAILKALAA